MTRASNPRSRVAMPSSYQRLAWAFDPAAIEGQGFRRERGKLQATVVANSYEAVIGDRQQLVAGTLHHLAERFHGLVGLFIGQVFFDPLELLPHGAIGPLQLDGVGQLESTARHGRDGLGTQRSREAEGRQGDTCQNDRRRDRPRQAVLSASSVGALREMVPPERGVCHPLSIKMGGRSEK